MKLFHSHATVGCSRTHRLFETEVNISGCGSKYVLLQSNVRWQHVKAAETQKREVKHEEKSSATGIFRHPKLNFHF